MISTPILPFLMSAVGAAIISGLLFQSPRLRMLLLRALAFLVAFSLLIIATARLLQPIGFGFDVAQIHNAIWNLVNGRWTQCDVVGQPLYSVHPLFTLPVYVPFYFLSETMAPLNLAHILLGVLACIPLYLLGRHLLGSRELGAVLCLIYLLLPSTSGFLFVECQPSIAGVPCFFAYLFCKHTGRTFQAVLWAILASFGWEMFLAAVIVEGLKETAAPTINRRFGLKILAAGLFTLALFFVNKTGYFDISSSRHYSEVGGSPFAAARLLFEDPGALIGVLATRPKIGFLAHLLVPLVFLPLGAGLSILFALPELTLVLLSDRGDDMHRIDCFYHHVTTVAIVYGTALTLRRLSTRRTWIPIAAAWFLAFNLLGLQFVYHHSFLKQTRSSLTVLRTHSEPAARIISWTVIPEGATVMVERRSDLALLPRRRAFLPDPFLTPTITESVLSGTYPAPEFLVLPRGRSPRMSAYVKYPDAWDFLTADVVGVSVFRSVSPLVSEPSEEGTEESDAQPEGAPMPAPTAAPQERGQE